MPWRRPADLLPRGTGSSREARATFDWESLRGGLLVTGAGMGVVFVVLFVLQLAIVALGAFDRAPAAAGVAPAAAPPAAPQAPAEDAAPEIAAAIAVALALAEEEERSRCPAAAAPGQAPPGGWVQAGRSRLMGIRLPRGRQGRGR